MATLRDFLKNRESDGLWNYTALNGGKYFIPEEDKPKFFELYVDSILDGEKQCLTEKNTEIGPCRGDFDFIYEKDIVKHVHTRDQVLAFCTAYMLELETYVQVPDKTQIYIFEKRKPTYDGKKNKMKSGIHWAIPKVNTHKFVEQRIRRTLVKEMDEFFPNLPLTEPWDKVYDEGVVNRSVNWTVYGSRKPDSGSLPYLISYILEWNGEEFEIVEGIKLPQLSVELLKDLSVYRDEADETPMTEEGKKLFDELRKSKPVMQTKRGRKFQRDEKPSSRASSPNMHLIQPLDPEKRHYLRSHVMNLHPERSHSHNDWIPIAMCLKNIHPELHDVFLDFMSQSPKYDENKYFQKWTEINIRNDGEKLGEGSLRFWSREDNFEGYQEIEKLNIDRLIMNACSLTEYDVASVILAKYRDNYRCTDFRNNIWYRWAGHIWQETDTGVSLLSRLSSDVVIIFFKKEAEITNEMANRDLANCLSQEDKKDCGKCDYCVLNKKRIGLQQVMKKLKTTAFKSNVMKECREIFFDETFNKKLDTNHNLIAFENGVFDIAKKEFREGRPDDYISLSTGVEYNKDTPYYEHPAWKDVEDFLKKVLIDEEVREYFLDHLASCMFGGNPAQKLHLLTGSGSNGKSMISNLMSTTMGDYACTIPISFLTQKRKSSGQAAPELVRLRGRRYITTQEPDDEEVTINTGLMKEITSGEKIYGRDLFKSGGDFEIQGKFHLACNEKPKVPARDGGTWRRFAVIEFLSKFVNNPEGPFQFQKDGKIQTAVLSKAWATVFASYLIHRITVHPNIRDITIPKKVDQYTDNYKADNDNITKFIVERIVEVDADTNDTPVDKVSLKRSFKQWKDENEIRNVTPASLDKVLIAKYGKYPVDGWKQIKLV